ncbi:MAG: clostripain-related cysteine peptidase [Bacilli bacterium]|nr:clostripain-related cysteine peptidase [Bacilli bacterium]
MYNDSIKKWTILIYADGNNEMEEIIYKSLLACEKIGSSNDINVVVQIGKLGNYKTDEKNNWSGVRRYYVENGHSNLIEDLDKTNLADPNTLYNFIKWGYENYKAEQFMLILSDHGGEFIGCFTDESLSEPYLMGIPEMIQAINAIRTNLGYIIDVLVMDMCYMNCVEIIYELGQNENPAVKSVVNYMDSAAYEGLNYEKLVLSTNEYNNLFQHLRHIYHLYQLVS